MANPQCYLNKGENVGIEGIENMTDNQDDATERADGEAERQRQDEERLADHEERRRRLGETERETETPGEAPMNNPDYETTEE